jgi:thymidylate kinase
MLLQWLATQHLEVTARGSGGLRLLEEGAVQTIWTAALRAGRLRPAELWGCVPSGCLPDAVLLVELSPELAAERLDARGSRHSRTQLLPRAERIGELRRGGELLDDVVAHCPAPVLRIPADGLSPGELAAAARSVVLTLARR